MALFQKNREDTQPANPSNRMLIKLLAVGYLLYTVYDMFRLYLAGGEDAPSIPLLVVAVVILGGGAVWVGVTTYKEWKRYETARQEAQDAEDALEEGQEDMD